MQIYSRRRPLHLAIALGEIPVKAPVSPLDNDTLISRFHTKGSGPKFSSLVCCV